MLITLKYWTLQNLKDSENKQSILHGSSVVRAITVRLLNL
jgi:hypothetical protein